MAGVAVRDGASVPESGVLARPLTRQRTVPYFQPTQFGGVP